MATSHHAATHHRAIAATGSRCALFPIMPSAILSVLMLSLLAGCGIDPQRPPAPVEQRSATTTRVPQGGGSSAVVIPQPDYSPTTTPATAADTASTTTGAGGTGSPGGTGSGSGQPLDGTIVALLTRANDQAAGGQYQAAAGSLERAIRIAPDDAGLWYELARIRLRQGELGEAEELAIKSRSMASGQTALQARNWRLVALVREQRGDPDGAAQALQTARELESGAI